MVAALLAAGALAQSVEVGMTEAKLLELKGAPQTKAAVGKKAIYRWPDMQVTLVEGRVEQFQYRDREAEKANAAERAAAEAKRKADAKAEKRETLAEAKRSAMDAKRAAAGAVNAQERRLLQMAYLQAHIRALEHELDEDARRSSFDKRNPPMSAEARAFLNLRLEKARAELAGLR
jgi:membrane protein involved in colicin uptake